MSKIFRHFNITLLLIAVIAIVGLVFYFKISSDATPAASTKMTLTPARIKSLTEMARLTSLEIDEETGINDTINGKGIFAIVRLKGTISFDIDHLRIDSIGEDSLRVYLPAEKVELLESTAPESYRVIDVWNVKHPLFPANITAAEENTVKRRMIGRREQMAYQKGHVRRARENALSSLRQLYSALPGMTVEVVDTAALR